MKLAWGVYQTALLNGYARWSGADLKGKARKYSFHYAISRQNLLKRIYKEEYGHLRVLSSGKIILVEGFPPDNSIEIIVSAGAAFKYTEEE